MGLLTFWKKEPQIVQLEAHDKKLVKEMLGLVYRLESHLKDLNKIVSAQDTRGLYAKFAELENVFLLMRSKADTIKIDIREIRDIEITHRNYIAFNDADTLQDKSDNLETIMQILDELIQLVSERPTLESIKNEYLYFMSMKTNEIIDSLNKIVSDDRQLMEIYSKIKEL